MLAAIGVQVPSFEAASELFERLTLVSISDNGVRKATEGIGQERLEAAWAPKRLELPEGPSQPPKRLYGSVDGTSVHIEGGWREAKLGSWYRTDDPPLDEVPEKWEGHAEEITYYGDIAEADEFR